MKKIFTPLIQERFHYDAKFSADEENWHFKTRITFVSHWNQILILSQMVALVICSRSMQKFYWISKEMLSKMYKENGMLHSKI